MGGECELAEAEYCEVKDEGWWNDGGGSELRFVREAAGWGCLISSSSSR